jgi:hypothetical protein
MITLVPYTDDHAVLIPVDLGRDPEGSLIIVGTRGGFTVRPVRPTDTDGTQRRRPHWEVCPHPRQWDQVRRDTGILPTRGYGTRSGPCVTCRREHPARYGGPVASPLCDPCREARGLTPIGTNVVA